MVVEARTVTGLLVPVLLQILDLMDTQIPVSTGTIVTTPVAVPVGIAIITLILLHPDKIVGDVLFQLYSLANRNNVGESQPLSQRSVERMSEY